MKKTTDFPAAVKDANERALWILDHDPSLAVLAGKTDKLILWRMAIVIAVAEIQFPSSVPPSSFRPAPASQGASDTKVDEGTTKARLNSMRARDDEIDTRAKKLMNEDPQLIQLARTDRSTAFKNAIRMAAEEIPAR
jgi:hypothetical protein